MAKRLSRPERNIRWIERHCRIPEGRDIGKPIRLRPWQKKILRGIYGSPTRRVIISVGRKNAKSALAACLCLMHLCGPEAQANSQLYSAAQSRDQAAIIFNLAAKMVRMSPDLAGFVTVRDTAKQLFCRELGTLYRALSAEATTAYGLSPAFVVHDELGQVKGPRSELYEALETASAAHENPLSVVISTQAPTDVDLLSVLIDDAKASHDPRVKLFLWSAPEDTDPFAEATIKAANPAFGDFQNADIVLEMAEDARRMPSREAEYRNLILNQRIEVRAPFISKSVWQGCAAKPREDFHGLPVFGGLDLSSVNDLTAKVYLVEIGGKWHVRPTFWLPEEGLSEKSRKDRVPYDLWAQAGYLATTPGRTIDYQYVAASLYADCERFEPRKIAFDRWNFKHLRPWLLKAGFAEAQIEGDSAIFQPFGQGYQSMSPALRDLETLLLDGRLAHGGHPVLTMCAANAVVTSDPAGNRKLDKMKATGRIDGMVALAMAAAMASTYEPKPQTQVVSARMMAL